VTRPPWRIVAIDDEPPALRALGRALATATDFTLCASSSDPLGAVALIRETRPDVLMLDIQMPGLTGFDIARELGAELPALVFLTAYDQYAVQAFDAAAIDYLLKPINPARLAETLDRLRRQLADKAGREMLPRLDALLTTLEARPPLSTIVPSRISIRRNGGTSFLDARSIERIDSADNDIRISAAGQVLSVRETLTAFAARLPAGQFLRVHRTCVVNLARVQHVEPYFHGDVVIHLTNGTKVISGRTYRAEVRAAFGLSRHVE
jgi:two-component system, LytTR family, response regulator